MSAKEVKKNGKTDYEKTRIGAAFYDFSFDVLSEQEERKLLTLLQEKRKRLLKELKVCFLAEKEIERITKAKDGSLSRKKENEYILAKKVFQKVKKVCPCRIGRRLEKEGKLLFCRSNLKRVENLLKEIFELTQKIFNHNARFILYFYKNFLGSGSNVSSVPNVPIEDILQQCSLGLLTAILKYDPEKSKGRFVTYAWYWMVAEISFYLFNYYRTVPVSRSLFREMLKIRNDLATKGIYFNWGKEEICDFLNVVKEGKYELNEEEVKKIADFIYACTSFSCVSLELMKERWKEDDDAIVDAFLYSHSSFYREEAMRNLPENVLSEKELMKKLKESLSQLPAREEYILRARTGIGLEKEKEKLTLKEIGEKLGCSVETVRTVEKRAIAKIKKIQAE